VLVEQTNPKLLDLSQAKIDRRLTLGSMLRRTLDFMMIIRSTVSTEYFTKDGSSETEMSKEMMGIRVQDQVKAIEQRCRFDKGDVEFLIFG
jgi:hypothetical protein